MKAKHVHKEDIPSDWRPWCEMVSCYNTMNRAIEEGRKNGNALLIAACLSAAKWITGNPSDLKSVFSCGYCIAKGAFDCYRHCPLWILHVPCTKSAFLGASMRDYAARFDAWLAERELER
jgi:hypothetical protein